MTVTEGHIDVGTTSVQLDTTLVTQSTSEAGLGRSVHREAVFLGDPVKAAARAQVRLVPPVQKNLDNQKYALEITDQRLEFLQGVLSDILGELRVVNAHLALASDAEFNEGDVP